MEMQQVRYFLAICETLNFTRAAVRCDVAQPSLTRAIKKLEEELGGQLFRRERRNTHLTQLGEIMKPHLEQIYVADETALAEARDYKALKRAPLKFGIMCTIGPERLVGFFRRLGSEISTIEVSMQEAPGKDLVELMMAGKFDIALIGMPTFPDRLDARVLYSERYVIAFPKGHRFEAMDTVPLGELDQEDNLVRVNCEYPDHFNTLGIPQAYEVNVKYQSEREDWIQAMILAGMGCSVMPEYLPTMSGIGTRLIVEPEISRTISLVTVAGRRFSPTVEALIRMARHHDWNAH